MKLLNIEPYENAILAIQTELNTMKTESHDETSLTVYGVTTNEQLHEIQKHVFVTTFKLYLAFQHDEPLAICNKSILEELSKHVK